MLFDEHGCHNNGDSQDQGTDADAFFLLKAFAADNGKVCTQRIIYMNAGPQVGRSVCPIQSGYHTGEDIVSRHNSGTKVLSVGPQGGYDQENRHAREEEDTGAVIILFVLEKEINDHSRYIGKPQKVRDDEHFTKRNIIIRRHMYDPVMSGSIFLQPGEPGHVNNAIYNKRNGMLIFQIEDP